uniref:amino acid ABC transporter substrate-binding protein n=1 Tax=Ningiella ruwaisensis TaxID=2364274 RepID=UPI0010A0C0C1|nr:amino acid ABC transporter substrate-binding protein [Ningiella ruwaisensis]
MRFLISILLIFLIVKHSDACEIKHPGKQGENDARQVYPLQLLSLILKTTEEEFGKCTLVDVGGVSQKRQISWLDQNNDELDIAWLPASEQTNEILTPIPVPIRKGLLGWRILLIHQDNLQQFESVKSLNDLNIFSAGYGSSWGDLSVMQYNFARVITSGNYDSLFEMLAHKRFDFLSRSIYEAYDETILRNTSKPEIIIAPKIALRYPQVDFFYVSKSNQALAKRIHLGMDKLIRNGKFNTLFYGFYADYIRKVNMSERLIIDLENPYLPDNVPHDDPELWFQLNEVDKYAMYQ